MKNQIKFLLVIASFLLSAQVIFAQSAETISLKQVPGEFEETTLTLEAGKAYVFEVSNAGVDHEVGFVVAPEGMTEQKNHIKNAYLTKTIEDGETATSKEVVLEKGEYVYFCPLNPTPQYKLVVK